MLFLKYGSIISVPLFAIIVLLLIKTAKDYSFFKSTVSKSILHLENKKKQLVFRLNFVVKATLDLGFALYVLNFFNIPPSSFWFWPWIISALLFSSLAYFVEGSHHKEHKILTYFSGIFWVLDAVYFAFLVGDNFFALLTMITMSIVLILTFGALYFRRTNVPIQTLCIILMYGWVISFVFQYL